jgi:hypothetical protein
MNYSQKTKELKSIIRELRLLNPNKRDYQLREDKYKSEIIDIALSFGTGSINQFEALRRILNLVEEQKMPIAPAGFRHGGKMIKERNEKASIDYSEWIYCEPKTPFKLSNTCQQLRDLS